MIILLDLKRCAVLPELRWFSESYFYLLVSPLRDSMRWTHLRGSHGVAYTCMRHDTPQALRPATSHWVPIQFDTIAIFNGSNLYISHWHLTTYRLLTTERSSSEYPFTETIPRESTDMRTERQYKYFREINEPTLVPTVTMIMG